MQKAIPFIFRKIEFRFGISVISHTFLVSSQEKHSQKINWVFSRTIFFGKISLGFNYIGREFSSGPEFEPI